MSSRKFGFVTLSVVALALAGYVVTASAQQAGATRANQPASGQPTTITGRVVDLHCYMTGQFPSADHAKCTADCIRQGVPTGIETADGLVIIGQGMNTPAKAIMPFAFQEVEATGKLFTKGNVRYLDLASIKAAAGAEGEEGSEE